MRKVLGSIGVFCSFWVQAQSLPPYQACTSCRVSNDFFEEMDGGQHKLPSLKNLLDSNVVDVAQTLSASFKLRDCGVMGKTFEIGEVSLITLIQNRLLKMQAAGTLEAQRQKIEKKVVSHIKNPAPLSGITKTISHKKRVYDPTFVVVDNIYDHKGTLMHAKGKTLNPLHHMSFGAPLIFIDGRDKEQIPFAQKIQREEGGKIVLIAGSPIDLGELLGIPLYFDQGGHLTHKFNIHVVPAVVRQKEDLLEIEEVVV
tara:strand:- start:2532 stop:3299 length:768 start_codon:yes stop_codon:yes gene_type:complete